MYRASDTVYYLDQQTHTAFIGLDNKIRLLFLYQFKYKIEIFSSRFHKTFFPH
jgi:hypothetical protein